MPLSSIDPDDLMAAVQTLAQVRSQLDEVDDELLRHHASLGDRDADRAVDDWVDQLADTLRAVNETAQQQALLMRNLATATTHTDTHVRELVERHDF